MVAQLTPGQVLQQQQAVFAAVSAQQEEQQLSEAAATRLLVDTLRHNGLPVPAVYLTQTTTNKPAAGQ